MTFSRPTECQKPAMEELICGRTKGPSINYVVSKSAIFILNRFYLVYLGPPYRDDIVFRRPLSNLNLQIEVGKTVPPKIGGDQSTRMQSFYLGSRANTITNTIN